MRDAGCEPLVDYPGAENPWPMRCRCGRPTTVRISNVDAGQRGCRACADYGFNSSKPAIVYLLVHREYKAPKVGITQSGSARVETFRKHGWEALATETFDVGIDAVRVEDAILKWWRVDLDLPIHLRPEMTPTGGWTETVDAEELSIPEAIGRLRFEASARRVSHKGPASLDPDCFQDALW